MVNLYTYYGDDMTILSHDEVFKHYRFNKEIVFVDNISVLNGWKEEIEKGTCTDSFGFYVLENGYGIQLSNEYDYDEEELENICSGYNHVFINGKYAKKEDIFDFECKYIYKRKSENIEVEIVKEAGELSFVFEQDYDDYHAIQIWKDAQGKFYKAVACCTVDGMTDILAILNEEEVEEEIYNMSQWDEQDQCYASSYMPYDDDEVIYSL